MKKYILSFITIFLFSYSSFAQNEKYVDSNYVKDGKIFFSDIEKVDSVKATDLYSRAKNWLAHEYNSAKAVIQVDDKDGGQIVSKGIMVVIPKGFLAEPTKIEHIVSIFVKDGKYKVEISEFRITQIGSAFGFNAPLESWSALNKRKLTIAVQEETIEMLESLKKTMNSPLTSDF